jgi:hypothetical protein
MQRPFSSGQAGMRLYLTILFMLAALVLMGLISSRQARMRYLKILLALAGLALVGVYALLAATRLDTEGHWPYAPLKRWERALTLANGGRLDVVEVENRDWLAKGNPVDVWYTPPTDTVREPAFPGGGLLGRANDIRAWSYGQIVVVLATGAFQSVAVRTASRGWIRLAMDAPNSDDLLAGRLPLNFSGLTVEEFRAMAAPADSLPPAFRGLLRTDDFSSATGELYLTYFVRPGQVNRVRLRLARDGSAFRLAGVERVTGGTDGAVPPYRAPADSVGSAGR